MPLHGPEVRDQVDQKENVMVSGAVTMDIILKSILVDSGAQISCVRESAMDMMVHVN